MSLSRRLVPLLLVLALAACSDKPRLPAWSVGAVTGDFDPLGPCACAFKDLADGGHFQIECNPEGQPLSLVFDLPAEGTSDAAPGQVRLPTGDDPCGDYLGQAVVSAQVGPIQGDPDCSTCPTRFRTLVVHQAALAAQQTCRELGIALNELGQQCDRPTCIDFVDSKVEDIHVWCHEDTGAAQP